MFCRVTLCCLLLFIQACAIVPREPLSFVDPSQSRVWPSAPEPARIKLIRIIKGPTDVVPPSGNFQKFFEAVTGETRLSEGFISPAGIASDGERLLYVADPGARLVHRYDLGDREVTAITSAGNESLSSPVGVALDHTGNCYVSDSVRAKVYKFSNSGEYLGTLGDKDLELLRPAGIAVSSRDEKFVVDVLAHKLYVFDKFDRFIKEFPGEREREEDSHHHRRRPLRRSARAHRRLQRQL